MTPEEIARFVAERTGERMDARETAHLAKQLEHVKARTYDVKYPAMKARRFIPVSNATPSGAETITYRQWDQYGMAKVVSNYADDLPRVDVVAKEFTSKVKSLGDAYGYSVQDLRRSAMAGSQLDTKRAQAARRAIESAIDEIAAFGLAGGGLTGFANNANVPVVSPANGSWTSASAPLDILEDMNKLVQSIVTATKEVHIPDTLLLPSNRFSIISQMFMSADNNKTVLRAFLDNNPYIRNVDQWHKLDEADAGGTGPRMVAYLRNPEILELEIPQEFEQFPPERRNLAFIIDCHARIGGVSMYYPLGVAYMDGI